MWSLRQAASGPPPLPILVRWVRLGRRRRIGRLPHPPHPPPSSSPARAPRDSGIPTPARNGGLESGPATQWRGPDALPSCSTRRSGPVLGPGGTAPTQHAPRPPLSSPDDPHSVPSTFVADQYRHRARLSCGWGASRTHRQCLAQRAHPPNGRPPPSWYDAATVRAAHCTTYIAIVQLAAQPIRRDPSHP